MKKNSSHMLKTAPGTSLYDLRDWQRESHSIPVEVEKHMGGKEITLSSNVPGMERACLDTYTGSPRRLKIL